MSKLAVEVKVVASTLASTAVGVVVAILNAVENDHSLMGSLPPVAQSVILVAAPPLLIFLAGWSARHTPRTVPAQPDIKGL